MPIKVEGDYDHAMAYEYEDMVHKIFIAPLVIFLTLKIFRILARKLIHQSKEATDVKRHATTHKALDIMYGFERKLTLRKGTGGFFAYILQHLSNPKALRNRLKLVKKHMRKSINQCHKENIIILNLGAGSARAVLETASEFSNKNFHIVLLDKNQDALDSSRKLSGELHIKGDIRYVHDKISSIKHLFSDLHPDIVEMVGILDYFDETRSVKVFNDIFDMLPPGGVFITGNIMPNNEEPLVTHLFGWPLVYKDIEDLKKIIKYSNFNEHRSSIVYEPLKIHTVIKLCK